MGRVNTKNEKHDPPAVLTDHQFYGVKLDEEQKIFRDAIWNPQKLIIIANAVAGTGKTYVATGVANLLVQYQLYDGIVYICSPYAENKQGYLPGDIEQKSCLYMEPFRQALESFDIDLDAVNVANITNQKNGSAYVECKTHTFLRGGNIINKVVIVDEAQNFTVPDLKKVLTRISDNCKVIICGHTGQIDLNNPWKSGFARYIQHFSNAGDDRVAICQLTHNHRGWISSYSDSLEE